MKQIIKRVLEEISTSQVNLTSAAARETVSSLISAALKVQGYNNKNKVNSYLTTDMSEEEQKARETWVCSICGENTYDVDYEYIGSCTNHLGCELELELEEPVRTEDGEYVEEGIRREKNYSQKKHEDKVFGHDQGGSYEKKVWPGSDAIQKQLYNEMTSDGLPEGEMHKLYWNPISLQMR